MSEVVRRRGRPLTYLNLVATSSSFSSRKLTRVLVAKRRGHIFIQTDQPIYTPMQPGSKKQNNTKNLKVNMQWNVNQCNILIMAVSPFQNHALCSEIQDIHS